MTKTVGHSAPVGCPHSTTGRLTARVAPLSLPPVCHHLLSATKLVLLLQSQFPTMQARHQDLLLRLPNNPAAYNRLWLHHSKTHPTGLHQPNLASPALQPRRPCLLTPRDCRLPRVGVHCWLQQLLATRLVACLASAPAWVRHGSPPPLRLILPQLQPAPVAREQHAPLG